MYARAGIPKSPTSWTSSWKRSIGPSASSRRSAGVFSDVVVIGLGARYLREAYSSRRREPSNVVETVVGVSTTGWWVAGSVAGAVAVVVAATLVLTVIALARRVVVQAREIEAALIASHRNTESLFDIAMMNHSLE